MGKSFSNNALVVVHSYRVVDTSIPRADLFHSVRGSWRRLVSSRPCGSRARLCVRVALRGEEESRSTLALAFILGHVTSKTLMSDDTKETAVW